MEKTFESTWMELKNNKIEKESFQNLNFSLISEKKTLDYLEVLKTAFEAPEEYINLHKEPVKRYGSEVFRLVAYQNGKPVSIGELRVNNRLGFIYSVGTIPEERDRRIATEIIRRLIEKAKEIDLDNIVLNAEGRDLVEFYSNRGFGEIFKVQSYEGGTFREIFEN